MRALRPITVIASGLVLVVSMAACTSGETSDSAKRASTDTSCLADPVSAEGSLPDRLPADYTPVSKTPDKAKTVINIGNSVASSTPATAEAMKKATQALGWNFEQLTYNGKVEDFNEKFEQAIAKNPTAITEVSVPPAAMQQQLAKAKAAGIIVAASAIADTPQGPTGLAAVTHGKVSFEEDADLAARWIMKDSGCAANVHMFGMPVPILQLASQQLVDTVGAECPNCKAQAHEISPQEVGTPAATNAIVSALQSDPSINYVGVATGGMAAGLSAALKQAGITGVKIFGISAPDVNSIKALQDGSNSMWLTSTAELAGWSLVDAVVRVLDSGQALPSMAYPVGIMTTDNVPEDAKQVPTYPKSYEADFEKLWLVVD